MRAFAASLLLLSSCGSAPGPATVAPTRASGAAANADWAMLLPIHTQFVLRIDFERLRRSPHRATVEAVLDRVIADEQNEDVRRQLHATLDRTQVLMLGFVPDAEDGDGEVVLFGRGDYAEDEAARVSASPEAPPRAHEIEGHRVYAADGDSPTAVAQLARDTLVITGTVDAMASLLARTRMEGGAPRWPSGVRPMVPHARFERATVSLALARTGFGDAEGGFEMAIGGHADLDGPLDIEVVVELGDASVAAGAAMVFEAMLREIARSSDPSAAGLRRIADLARIEPRGTRVHGSLHADRATAAEVLPALLSFLTEEMDDDVLPNPPNTI